MYTHKYSIIIVIYIIASNCKIDVIVRDSLVKRGVDITLRCTSSLGSWAVTSCISTTSGLDTNCVCMLYIIAWALLI